MLVSKPGERHSSHFVSVRFKKEAQSNKVKIRDVVRLVEDDGWFPVRTRGSHRQYHHRSSLAPSPLPASGPGFAPQDSEQYSETSRTTVKFMQYTIIIERGSKNFSAYVPDFPGCVAAADTEEETVALMKEALEMHIEDMRARGEPLLPPSEARPIEVAA